MKSYFELAEYGRYFAGLLIVIPVIGHPTTGRVALWRNGTRPQIHRPERHATGWTSWALRWAIRRRLWAGAAVASTV